MVIDMWARIENIIVMELTDIDPSDRFHPSLFWVECEIDAVQYMLYQDGYFFPAPVDPE